IPADAQAWIEQPVEIEGQIEVLHVDYADGTGEFRYFLKTDLGERISLHFTKKPQGYESGAELRASGLLLENVSADGSEDADGAMAIAAEETDIEVLALGDEVAAAPSSGLANTFGQQNTIILLVNFQDNPGNKPWTTTTIDAMADGTLSNFFRENSNQQTWLNVDTFGWYTLPLNGTSCSYTSIDGAAATAATNAGVNLSAYSRRIYVFPSNSACGWSGLGTIGGNPSKSWINGLSSFGVYAHEMGHNFGLYHSHALDCGSVTLCASGTTIEYGHFGDTMGNNVDGHYNSFQKERLGWLAYNSSPTVSTAQSTGNYTVKPYSAADGGPKALKVLKGIDGAGKKTYYYIESRRAIGFDAPLANVSGGNFLSGVTISIGTESSPDSSFLLDMTPTVGSDFRDAALAVNQSFTDSAAGVTITPLSANDTQATISVSMGGVACARAYPTVSVTPDQSQWMPPGTAVIYDVSVTNNDGSGCASSTFNLTATMPSGWTAAYGVAALNLAAGASGTTTLQITSPGSAADGFYDFTATARNSGATTYSGSDTATYVVSAAPPNSPPVAVNDSAKTGS
ncbi:MAG: NEW3 domain-containing protein, partial [Dongiaceae bacterium]